MAGVQAQRWLARLSFVLLAGALGVLIAFAGRRSIAVLLSGALAVCVTVACLYWFLAKRGVFRWAAFTVAVVAPAGLIALYVTRDLLWVAVVAVCLVAAGMSAGRAAMGAVGQPGTPGDVTAARASHPFLIMNPRSGGGKVARFGLAEKAEALGAEVVMLEGPQTLDVAAMATKAVADGADLLGVAGGDGTQALVAGVAAEHDLPFLCISAGTRNHFAMDLGLDRDDPSRCLDALTDGVEQRIDLGMIGDRIFVNNASFGVYAEIVRSPAYRDDKRGTTLEMLPELLGDGDHHLSAAAGNTKVDDPQAVLISNNPYETDDIAGLGRRARLDTGKLGVIAITVRSAAQAIRLFRRGQGQGLIQSSSADVTVDSDRPEIPVGIDGETVLMPTPVRCSIRAGALRVVVPRNRPGARPVRKSFSWARLATLAGFGSSD